jgi:hypothetical protein
MTLQLDAWKKNSATTSFRIDISLNISAALSEGKDGH